MYQVRISNICGLRELSFGVADGQITQIYGRNESGKTSTAHALSALLGRVENPAGLSKLKMYVNDAADDGEATLMAGADDFARFEPGGDGIGVKGSVPRSHAVACGVGLDKVILGKPADRAEVWQSIIPDNLNEDEIAADIVGSISDKEVSADEARLYLEEREGEPAIAPLIREALAMIRQEGWDAAADLFAERRRTAKHEWERVVGGGHKYGSSIGANPPIDGHHSGLMGKSLTELREVASKKEERVRETDLTNSITEWEAEEAEQAARDLPTLQGEAESLSSSLDELRKEGKETAALDEKLRKQIDDAGGGENAVRRRALEEAVSRILQEAKETAAASETDIASLGEDAKNTSVSFFETLARKRSDALNANTARQEALQKILDDRPEKCPHCEAALVVGADGKIHKAEAVDEAKILAEKDALKIAHANIGKQFRGAEVMAHVRRLDEKVADARREIEGLPKPVEVTDEMREQAQAVTKRAEEMREQYAEKDKRLAVLKSRIDELKAKAESGKSKTVATAESQQRSKDAQEALEVARRDLDAATRHAQAVKAHQSQLDYDRIAQRLGSKGIRNDEMMKHGEVIAQNLERICNSLGFPKVSMEMKSKLVKLRGREMPICSKSGQWRAKVAMQLLAARLTGSSFVVIDEADILDADAFAKFSEGLPGLLAKLGEKPVGAFVIHTSSETPVRIGEKSSLVHVESGGNAAA